jgi:hypothetical protein
LSVDVRWFRGVRRFIGRLTLDAGEDVVGGNVDEEGIVGVGGFCEGCCCGHVEGACCFGVACAGVGLSVCRAWRSSAGWEVRIWIVQCTTTSGL